MNAGDAVPARRWPMSAWLLGGLATVLLLAYGAALAALWWGQERLLFQPTPLPATHRFRLAADVHEVDIDVPGARLNALHLRLPHPDGVVFFLHGNAGNLESWFVNPDFYRAMNVDLFMFDYRGYGKSSGQIGSEAQLLADAQTAWAQVAPTYAGRPVVFYGRSLGSGLAARLAAALAPPQRPDLLLLVSPYRSLQALATEHYPFVPAAVLRYPVRTDLALQGLMADAPGAGRPRVLLLHGERDTLIPPAHSDALAALAPGVTVQHIAGAGHGDLQAFPAYLAAVRTAIRAVVAPQPH
jgi:alpha-beta hydrolase superfamily lysophospholipase